MIAICYHSLMKLNQLRDLVAIAEHGGLRAAARRLKLAQPALSRSVRELEREVGGPLFERRTRGMVPTPIGEVLIRRARAVMREVERAGDEVKQLQGGTGGKVVAGLSFAAHVALLPKALQPFRDRYPQVQLQVLEGVYPALEAGLKDGSIDFYVGPQPERPPTRDLIQEKLFDNVRVILGRKGHPLAGARALRDLAGAEWITSSVTFEAEKELDQLFTKHSLPPPRLGFASSSILTTMVLLANSDLLAMVPVQWTGFAMTDNWLARIPVKEVLAAPSIVMVRRAGLPLTPAAELLLDLMRRSVPRSRAA
jgi:DNA-binding transcriptional LysR family regulator